MAKKPLPCPTLLRLLLTYEPETGKLFWKERKPWMFKAGKTLDQDALCRRWNTRYAHKNAFCARRDGYAVGSVFGKMTYGHRVAWAMHNGVWPIDFIDHVDGVPSNNAIRNLRAVSALENARNSRARSGSSIYKGVHWSKSRQRWIARVRDGSGRIAIGEFKNEEDAAMAYNRAAEALDAVHFRVNRILGGMTCQ